MILIKSIVFKLLFFITLFFIFNLDEIDSNSDKRIMYNLNNIHEENYYTLYLKDIKSGVVDEVFNKLNIKVISYIINDRKYYARDIDDLINKYTKELSTEDKIYYINNGVKIDAVTTRCEVYQVIELEKMNLIY